MNMPVLAMYKWTKNETHFFPQRALKKACKYIEENLNAKNLS